MRISVVVPFRDAEPHLARCLASLRGQEPFDGDYQVIAVSDRSSDGSTGVVRRFPEVTLLSASNTGPYAARNAGAAASEGDVIALTDADCEAAPDWLRRIAEAFAHPATAVTIGPRLPASEPLGLSLLAAYERAKDAYVFEGRHVDLYYASANNMAVRRTVFEELGGFDERRRGSDTLLVRHIARTHSPDAVRYVPAMHVSHLEITRMRDYYRKSLAYSRSMGALENAPGRQLAIRERLAVWRFTVQRERYDAPRAAALLAALAGGAVCWELGGASARLVRKSR